MGISIHLLVDNYFMISLISVEEQSLRGPGGGGGGGGVFIKILSKLTL